MMPFAQYAAQWLEANAYALIPAPYRSYRAVIHTHVVPFFKDVPLGHVGDAHLKRLIAYLRGLQGKGGQPMGPKTINNYLGPLKTMLKETAEKKLLSYDPTVFVKRLRVPKPDIDPFAPRRSRGSWSMSHRITERISMWHSSQACVPTSRSRANGNTSTS
jgi:integrase